MYISLGFFLLDHHISKQSLVRCLEPRVNLVICVNVQYAILKERTFKHVFDKQSACILLYLYIYSISILYRIKNISDVCL